MLKFTKDQKEQALKMQKRHKTPVWEGPESDGKNGGVTQSLLGRFLVCRERFRLLVVEGLKTRDTFNHRLGYGTMFHLCMEWQQGTDWEAPLLAHVNGLLKKYPHQQDEIEKWYNVCRIQFPIYAKWWEKHPSTKTQTVLMSEQEFNVPYKLPSGRTVRLRGKWDGVNLVGKGKEAGVWLLEHKTKGEIDERQIVRQLNFDLQTMLYLVALEYHDWRENFDIMKSSSPLSIWDAVKIKGVIYNVIRRPLSGGKGNIVRHKGSEGSKCPKCNGRDQQAFVNQQCPKCNGRGRIGGKPEESWGDYWKRVEQYIEDDPKSYFMRWDCEINSGDVVKFKRECLDPILEQLCDWWEETSFIGGWSKEQPNKLAPCNFRMPFGVYNPLLEGNPTDMDDYLATGGMAGLQRTTDLFPELNGA